MSERTQPWHAALGDVPSRGSRHIRDGSGLAGLHRDRQAHLGQFWTPEWVADAMWSLVRPSLDQAFEADGCRAGVLDNSIGCGRLIRHADPERHVIGGCDIDLAPLAPLRDALSAAGFDYTVLHAGMDQIKAKGYVAALINPPFSIHLESPLLKDYPCVAFGRYGAGTSAMSHLYATYQALEAAQVVAALLPASAVDTLKSEPTAARRLRAILRLPASAFADENADVGTVVCLFGGDADQTPVECDYSGGELPESVTSIELLDGANPLPARGPLIHRVERRDNGPTIHLPVTGDRRVRVYRRQRFLRLHFTCGATQARVLNAIHRERLVFVQGQDRRPASAWSRGQGQLDLQVHLMQPDPVASVLELLQVIRDAGGEPELEPSILPWVRKQARRFAVERIPVRHTVWIPADSAGIHDTPDSTFTATVRLAHPIDPNRWGSPRCHVGDKLEITCVSTDEGVRYRYGQGPVTATVSRAEIAERFHVAAGKDGEGEWRQVHDGRAAAFPELAACRKRAAEQAGVTPWLSWDFQLQDLVEMLMTPGKAVNSSMMGLGKTRVATALCIAGGGRRNLVVVQANLIEEFIIELRNLGIAEDEWQNIETPEQTQTLRRINLISYTRLRMPLRAGSKRTFSKALRGRIHTLVADEAHALANESLQTAGIYQVSPKRRYGFTGSPAPNYPRSVLPLIIWAAGDGTAANPYGYRAPYMEPVLVRSMEGARRGVDVFREKHVATEWITHAWAESLSEGAKREVPTLRNLDEFRHYVGRYVMRRVWSEPDVARFIQIPEPTREVVTIPWNERHLSLYLAVAEEFRDWWLNYRSELGTRQANLVAILAHIGAVFTACNQPQELKGQFAKWSGLTSKQTYTLDLLTRNAIEGRKTVLFARSPAVCSLLHDQLARRGITSVLFTGKQTIKRRVRQMDAEFRHGDCSTLLSTFGCNQAGTNYPQATDEVFYNREWSPRQETQAEYRALRPQQTNSVRITRLHLEGSLDKYMGVMCDMKQDSSNAGLDWGTPEYTADQFQHWMTILNDFCNELSDLRGIERRHLREDLAHVD